MNKGLSGFDLDPSDGGAPGDAAHQTLWDQLARLALRSEQVADLSERLARASNLLGRFADHPSPLGDAAVYLRRKVEQLAAIEQELAAQVMGYSHRLEDAAEVAAVVPGPYPTDRGDRDA